MQINYVHFALFALVRQVRGVVVMAQTPAGCDCPEKVAVPG